MNIESMEEIKILQLFESQLMLLLTCDICVWCSVGRMIIRADDPIRIISHSGCSSLPDRVISPHCGGEGRCDRFGECVDGGQERERAPPGEIVGGESLLFVISHLGTGGSYNGPLPSCFCGHLRRKQITLVTNINTRSPCNINL